MLTSAVSISKDGNWTASTGEVYAVFLGINIFQGFLGSLATRILARLQNIFVFANFAIIIATFAALPATTPVDERNSAQFIFGDWQNITGVLADSILASIAQRRHSMHPRQCFGQLPVQLFAPGLLGWLCVIVIVACMGTNIASHLASPYGQSMASVYALRLGKQGTLAIWSCMFVIQFAMGMSILLSCSRQMWAFSRDNALPMLRLLKRVKRKSVPVCVVWAAVLCSLLLGIFPFVFH